MKRWHIIFIAAVLILGIAVAAGYRMGVRLLQDKIVEALGPGSRLKKIEVNWFSLELTGLSIDAPGGWPAARTLEAERLTIVPDLRSLLTDQIRIFSVVVEKPYLSMVRVPGKLRMVPSLTERKDQSPEKKSASGVIIASVEFKNGTVELYDATVSRPPLKTRMEQIDALIRDVAVPPSERTGFEIEGIVKGGKDDGRARITGWVGPEAKDSSSRIILSSLDMVALQPYLVKKNEARISKGTLDLNLDSEVRNNKLDGKGKIILKQLEFAPSRGLLDTFMGLPRDAVIRFLKNHDNAIDVDFILKGDTSKPSFSLNENLSTRIAASMADELGVSIKSVAGDIGTLGQKSLQGAGSIVEGIGSTVKGLFGGDKKK